MSLFLSLSNWRIFTWVKIALYGPMNHREQVRPTASELLFHQTHCTLKKQKKNHSSLSIVLKHKKVIKAKIKIIDIGNPSLFDMGHQAELSKFK